MTNVIRIHNERLIQSDIQDIQSALDTHQLRLLSLRGCRLTDQQFWYLARALGRTRSLLQLGLNLGVLDSQLRINMLAQALHTNRAITALLLHGSRLGDRGTVVLGSALALHPNIVTLDLGDCDLTDEGLTHIIPLLHTKGAKLGLKDLTLSTNPKITHRGWVKFAIGMASACELQQLALDHTSIGDDAVTCLAVAMAACKALQVVDLERTAITEVGVQILVEMLEMTDHGLTYIVLKGNKLKRTALLKIENRLKKEDAKQTPDVDKGIPNGIFTDNTPKFRDNVIAEARDSDVEAEVGTGDGGVEIFKEMNDKDKILASKTESKRSTPVESWSKNLRMIEQHLTQIVKGSKDKSKKSPSVKRGKMSRGRMSVDEESLISSPEETSAPQSAEDEDASPRKTRKGYRRKVTPRGRMSIDDAMVGAMAKVNDDSERNSVKDKRVDKEDANDEVIDKIDHIKISHIRQDSLGSVCIEDDSSDLSTAKCDTKPILPSITPSARGGSGFKALSDTPVLLH